MNEQVLSQINDTCWVGEEYQQFISGVAQIVSSSVSMIGDGENGNDVFEEMIDEQEDNDDFSDEMRMVAKNKELAKELGYQMKIDIVITLDGKRVA